MKRENERYIEEYKVINSMYLGAREIVLCENLNDSEHLYYMVCDVVKDDIFYNYYDNSYKCVNYMMAVQEYVRRLNHQIAEIEDAYKRENVPEKMITADMCNVDIFKEDLERKILVVSPQTLRGEYRTATHQIIKCTGGFGAKPDARGNAIFSIRMFDGQHSRFERYDILGELKPEYYPEWLKGKLEHEE